MTTIPPRPPKEDKPKKEVLFTEITQYNLKPRNTGLTLKVVPKGRPAYDREDKPDESYVRIELGKEYERLNRDEILRLIAALQRAIELLGPEGSVE